VEVAGVSRSRWFLPDSPDILGGLREQAAITREGSEVLAEWASGKGARVEKLIAIEHRGDAAKRALLDGLREAFVTPIEPEDAFTLSRGIDWVLDYSRDLASEADAMGCEPDEGIAEMTGFLAEAARRLEKAVAALGRDDEDPNLAADSAIRAVREMEHRYYRGMAVLLEVEERRERIALRELYRGCERIGSAVTDVAERIVYASVKQS
jgi:uncharacterized protein Yka (UPF0111/DUF47 family)